MNKAEAVVIRFVKGFLAGGFAQIAVYLGTGFTISNTGELKQFGYGLLMSFLVGGLLATEKALTWKP
jgi:hypothetical protein